MKIIYFLFISLLLFSCSQNVESSNDESKKEIDKDTETDTLSRIEFNLAGEDLTFSIGKIPEFDTIIKLSNPDYTSCSSSVDFIYTQKKNPIALTHYGAIGYPDNFLGIHIEIPRYKSGKCYKVSTADSIIARLGKLYERDKSAKREIFKTKHGKYEFVSVYDTLDSKLLWYASIPLDSFVMRITVCGEVNNPSFMKKICNSALSIGMK